MLVCSIVGVDYVSRAVDGEVRGIGLEVELYGAAVLQLVLCMEAWYQLRGSIWGGGREGRRGGRRGGEGGREGGRELTAMEGRPKGVIMVAVRKLFCLWIIANILFLICNNTYRHACLYFRPETDF